MKMARTAEFGSLKWIPNTFPVRWDKIDKCVYLWSANVALRKNGNNVLPAKMQLVNFFSPRISLNSRDKHLFRRAHRCTTPYTYILRNSTESCRLSAVCREDFRARWFLFGSCIECDIYMCAAKFCIRNWLH